MDSDLPKNFPVDKGKAYTPGTGQLCRKCRSEIYRTDDYEVYNPEIKSECDRCAVAY